MFWTLELASHLEDAPWPATKDELIDYSIRSGAPIEVIENLQELEDEGEIMRVWMISGPIIQPGRFLLQWRRVLIDQPTFDMQKAPAEGFFLCRLGMMFTDWSWKNLPWYFGNSGAPELFWQRNWKCPCTMPPYQKWWSQSWNPGWNWPAPWKELPSVYNSGVCRVGWTKVPGPA